MRATQQATLNLSEQEFLESNLSSSVGKVFVGGLSWDTNNDGLKSYFSQYGNVVEAVIMRDRVTGRSRGFGFVTFAEDAVADQVARLTHSLDGRVIEAKKAVSREEMAHRGLKTKKVFVGGIAMTVTDAQFREYFSKFGPITESQIMLERDTGRPRGFGFVTFENEESVEKVLNTPHEIGGKMVEVKRAEPKRSAGATTNDTNRNQNTFGHIGSRPGTAGGLGGLGGLGVPAPNSAATSTFFGPYSNPLTNYTNNLDRGFPPTIGEPAPAFPGMNSYYDNSSILNLGILGLGETTPYYGNQFGNVRPNTNAIEPPRQTAGLHNSYPYEQPIDLTSPIRTNVYNQNNLGAVHNSAPWQNRF